MFFPGALAEGSRCVEPYPPSFQTPHAATGHGHFLQTRRGEMDFVILFTKVDALTKCAKPYNTVAFWGSADGRFSAADVPNSCAGACFSLFLDFASKSQLVDKMQRSTLPAGLCFAADERS